MIVFLSPFKYLRLRNERGTRLFFRDFWAIFLLAGVFSAPFIFFDQVNFSRAAGFVDKMGSLASVLAGFYIAALVAVGSFSASIGDLDKEITNGKIYLNPDDDTSLTRREYICAIFGFLSFLAFFLAVLSAFILIIAPPIHAMTSDISFAVRDSKIEVFPLVRVVTIVGYSVIVSAMIVTTFYGLYYLTDRIYEKAGEILPKDDRK